MLSRKLLKPAVREILVEYWPFSNCPGCGAGLRGAQLTCQECNTQFTEDDFLVRLGEGRNSSLWWILLAIPVVLMWLFLDDSIMDVFDLALMYIVLLFLAFVSRTYSGAFGEPWFWIDSAGVSLFQGSWLRKFIPWGLVTKARQCRGLFGTSGIHLRCRTAPWTYVVPLGRSEEHVPELLKRIENLRAVDN